MVRIIRNVKMDVLYIREEKGMCDQLIMVKIFFVFLVLELGFWLGYSKILI